MRGKSVVLVNGQSTFAKNAVTFFATKGIEYIFLDKKPLPKLLEGYVSQGHRTFFLCGGDGTVSSFLDAYMKLNSSIRKKIVLGIIPCGRANDLSRMLRIPSDVEKAFHKITTGSVYSLDVLQVNNRYFVTGGGLGLPTEVVHTVNEFSRRHIRANRILKDLIYYLFVLKKMVFGYAGVDIISIDGKRVKKKGMLFAVHNQPFIGKRFLLCPAASNTDSYLDWCFIEKPRNAIGDLTVLHNVIKGAHAKFGTVTYGKAKKIFLKTARKTQFMADGEIVAYSNTFSLKVHPSRIRVLC